MEEGGGRREDEKESCLLRLNGLSCYSETRNLELF